MTTDFRALEAANRRTTWWLMAASFVLLALVAVIVSYLLIGGAIAALIGIGIAVAGTWGSYQASDRIAIASTGAPADPQEFQRLHNLVEEMAIAAGLPKPRVFVVDDPAPNAFATGKTPSTQPSPPRRACSTSSSAPSSRASSPTRWPTSATTTSGS